MFLLEGFFLFQKYLHNPTGFKRECFTSHVSDNFCDVLLLALLVMEDQGPLALAHAANLIHSPGIMSLKVPELMCLSVFLSVAVAPEQRETK